MIAKFGGKHPDVLKGTLVSGGGVEILWFLFFVWEKVQNIVCVENCVWNEMKKYQRDLIFLKKLVFVFK